MLFILEFYQEGRIKSEISITFLCISSYLNEIFESTNKFYKKD